MGLEIRKNDTVHEGIYTFFIDELEAAQKWGTLEAFKVFKDEGIEEVIEIGTCRGGFALMLRMVFPSIPIFTCDIAEWEPVESKRHLFRENRIHFIKDDAYKCPRLNNLVMNKKRSLILCDGAHKNEEFNFFASFMNEGSFIGGHDYFADGKHDEKIWTACELWYTQIKNRVENFHLQEFKPDIFAPVVWTMFQKK